MSIYAREMVLPDNEYVKTITKKTQIVLHHTSGSSDPTAVIAGWDVDPARIATHNVIGGISLKGNTEWDGKIVKAIDSKYCAFHLGVKGADDPTHKPQGYYDRKSVAAEVCNYGQLTLTRGVFYNYLNKPVPKSMVTDLGKPFRGFQYFQSYTDNQIAALMALIQYHARNEGIVLEKGRVFTWADFECDIRKFGERPLAFHVNFRRDKWDMYPHPKLLSALTDLHLKMV